MSRADRARRIAVLDYGMGNRRSVEKALAHVGADAVITGEPGELAAAAGIVVPGVGAFARGMERLRACGLDILLRARAAAGQPILGVCLGMQLLLDSSTELGGGKGLGLIPGEVHVLQTGGLPLPHIGWTEVRRERESPLLCGDAPFYHVHSYAAHPADPADVVATAEYGERFATVIARDNVYGVQFHPEKSSRDGLGLLANFVAIAERPHADHGHGRQNSADAPPTRSHAT